VRFLSKRSSVSKLCVSRLCFKKHYYGTKTLRSPICMKRNQPQLSFYCDWRMKFYTISDSTFIDMGYFFLWCSQVQMLHLESRRTSPRRCAEDRPPTPTMATPRSSTTARGARRRPGSRRPGGASICSESMPSGPSDWLPEAAVVSTNTPNQWPSIK